MNSTPRDGASTENATIPALVDAADRRLGSRVIWQVPAGSGFAPRTADDVARVRREIAAGLVARGIEPGDRVAIVAHTSAEWAIADLAILSVGAVTVGIYPTCTREQMRAIAEHAGCVAAFVQGSEARAAMMAGGTPAPLGGGAHSPRGMRFVVDVAGAELRALSSDALLFDEVARRSAATQPDDVATVVYTSGTTGEPKGVVLTHRALFTAARVGVQTLEVSENDVGVGFLPLAHALARVNFYGTLHAGPTTWFARSLEEVADVWQAAHPTCIAVVPRVLEKIRARILGAVAESPLHRQKLFARALEVGVARVRLIEENKPIPRRLAAEHALWERLVYRRVRAGLGWDRLRFCLCGGAPLARDVAELFHAFGVVVLEGYGLSETSAASVLCLPAARKIGSVGKPLAGVDVKIASDGEILLRGPGLFSRYEKDEAATRAAFDDDGYFRTGDIGVVDSDGYLRITDRKKDLIVTAGGKNIAPQAIEAALTSDPRVSQAVVVGDGRPYLVALLAIDPTLVASSSRESRERVAADVVARANAGLARYEQVKKWAVLDHELTIESGMLTPTQKVKRRAVSEKYVALIEGLYTTAGQAPPPR